MAIVLTTCLVLAFVFHDKELLSIIFAGITFIFGIIMWLLNQYLKK